MEKPLVSICLTAHNRKKFIGAALKSILDQTYSPLEIVISDNASTDGTSEIISSMVDAYARNGGPHKIIYRRNEQNIGAIRNVEQSYKMATGELLVEACDDDIAFPERVEKIVEAWLETGKKATAIVHGWKQIDLDGNILGEQAPWGIIKPWSEVDHDIVWLRSLWPLGAAMAFSPDIVRLFHNVSELTAWDDCIWLVRAMMLGCPYYISDRLVYYRIGSGASTSLNTVRSAQKRLGENGVAAGRQSLADLNFYRAQMPAAWYPELVSLVKHRIQDFDNVRRCFTSDSFLEKFVLLATKTNLMMQCLPPRLLCTPFILLPKKWGNPILNWLSEKNWERRRHKIGERVKANADGYEKALRISGRNEGQNNNLARRKLNDCPPPPNSRSSLIQIENDCISVGYWGNWGKTKHITVASTKIANTAIALMNYGLVVRRGRIRRHVFRARHVHLAPYHRKNAIERCGNTQNILQAYNRLFNNIRNNTNHRFCKIEFGLR